jgi:hypothetical protein
VTMAAAGAASAWAATRELKQEARSTAWRMAVASAASETMRTAST